MLNTNFMFISFLKLFFNHLLSFITAHPPHTVDEVYFLASYEIEMTTEIMKLHGMSQFVKSFWFESLYYSFTFHLIKFNFE